MCTALHAAVTACRFVNWMQRAYPDGGVREGLVEVLERATRSLLHLPQLKNNYQYTTLWLKYVRVRGKEAGRALA
ncbi:hypothetical protein EON66_02640 [archaeon]|nr:MAG: hypothetical protein EON66_02640 [archaeon]